MNVQKPMAIHFFPEGTRPAVILYTSLWDAYLNEFFLSLWKLYLEKQNTADVITFPDVSFCPKLTLNTEGALAHSAPCQAAANHSPWAEPGVGTYISRTDSGRFF